MTDTPWFLKDYKKALTGKGKVLPLVEQHLMRQSVSANSKRDNHFLHPSSISKKYWCQRNAYYTIKFDHRPNESLNLQRLNVFAEGNAIHNKWQSWLADLGVLEGNWICKTCQHKWWSVSSNQMRCPECESNTVRYAEVPIEDEEHHLLGHADGIVCLNTGKAVLEIKSVGPGTFRYEAPEAHASYSRGSTSLTDLWNNLKTPFQSHIRQVSLYMHCLGIHDAIVIYEFKPTQAVKEFNLKLQPHLIDKVLEGCKEVKAALVSDTVPERPDWAVSKTCIGCKSCAFIDKCWRNNENSSSDDRGSGIPEVSGTVLPARQASSGDPDDAGHRRVARRNFDVDL